MLEIVLPKNYINLLAGMVSLVFEQLNDTDVTVPKAKVTIDDKSAKKKIKPKAVVVDKPDDLTVINGIGPTFAKRLKAAGIATYQALAKASPEHVKEVAKLQDWQANPEDWIAEAKELA